MATSDDELIQEVRSFTGYTSTNTFTDGELWGIVDVGKEEIRAEIGQPEFEFYRTGETTTLSADRALFWFTCIGTKVHTGELGSISLTVNDLESGQANESTYNYWMSQFATRMSSARTSHSEDSGASTTLMERTDRSYSFETPN